MMVHPERFIVHNEYVSDEKRAELFRRASVVVLPYIEASQSGIIPIAYRFGKPVVATTVGGLPEWSMTVGPVTLSLRETQML